MLFSPKGIPSGYFNLSSDFGTKTRNATSFLGIEGISKIVYAATLQDSNDYYCPEMITDIDVLAKYANNNIEIVKELHRDKAVEILKRR